MHTPHQQQPRGARAPAALILIVLILALAVLGGVLGWLAYQFSLLDPSTAAALRWVIFWLPIVLGAIGGTMLAVEVGVIAWRRWATHEYIKAAHITRMTQAQAQRFPASLTSLSFHDSSRPQATPAAPEPLALSAPEPTTPTFAQLLDAGRIGPGRSLILGFDAASGQAIEGSWRDLYSCGIGALQGAGKSWLAAFLLAQSAAAGGRLIVCDLHAGNPESLATRIAALSSAFMCDVANTPDAILSALKLASSKLEQRKAGRGGAWPIIVAIDEWTSLLRTGVGAVLPGYLEDISEQGRKFNVNALLCAQGWTKDTAGVVRNRLTSHYVMRQRPDEARYQLGLPSGSLPLDVRLLPDAVGYLLDVRGSLTKIVIPQMTETDLARVGAMVAAPAAIVGQPFGFVPAPKTTTPTATLGADMEPDRSRIGAGSTAAQSAIAVSPDAARVLALLQAGYDLPAIVLELRGVSSKQSGSRYQAALREITDLLRQATKGASS